MRRVRGWGWAHSNAAIGFGVGAGAALWLLRQKATGSSLGPGDLLLCGVSLAAVVPAWARFDRLGYETDRGVRSRLVRRAAIGPVLAVALGAALGWSLDGPARFAALCLVAPVVPTLALLAVLASGVRRPWLQSATALAGLAWVTPSAPRSVLPSNRDRAQDGNATHGVPVNPRER